MLLTVKARLPARREIRRGFGIAESGAASATTANRHGRSGRREGFDLNQPARQICFTIKETS